MLHGILQDSRAWRRQIEELSRDFTVIAWDAPGCGQSSDPPEQGFGPAEYANCLAELLHVFDAAPAHIVGLSFGGVLAQEFYRNHPSHVVSLVLADTYAGWRGSLPAEVVEQRLAGCMRESGMRAEEFVPGWISGLLTDAAPQQLREELAAIMSDFHPAGYRVMGRAFGNLDTCDLLPQIQVPTLLVWGDDDRRSPLNVAERFLNLIPGARLITIPNAGHVSNLEQPQLFNAEVRRFCRAVSDLKE